MSRLFYTRARRRIPLQGVIFDMDGTLTVPVLDFSRLRALLGVSDGTDVLEHAANAPVEKRKAILRTIEDFEMEGNRRLKLQPSLFDLFALLRREGVECALVTRNNKRAVEAFLDKIVENDTTGMFCKTEQVFSQVVTRDFVPTKPSPAPALHVCDAWKCRGENVIFVGDDKDDVICGKHAGALTVLMENNSNGELKELSDFHVNSLGELVQLLKDNFTETTSTAVKNS